MRQLFDPDEFFWCGSLSGRQEECGTDGQAQTVSRRGHPNPEVSTRDSVEAMCLPARNT